jgi:hypothetical protein
VDETTEKTWEERVAELQAAGVNVEIVHEDPRKMTVVFLGEAREEPEPEREAG